jgi:MerR family transcriptional regulator, thiopeptide resistance regulator
MTKVYQVQEFAVAAGVTVRALHHYDRMALLQPKRTDAGYRLYSLRDLERVEQIVALKLLGLPLKEIKGVLDRDTRRMPDILRAQRQALEEKRRQLDRVIHAIEDAERTIQPGVPPDPAILKRLIEVIEMQDNVEHMKQYYSDEAWAELTRRREQMTPDMRDAAERGTRLWLELFRDVEAALGEDPGSDKAQTLVDRWTQLVESFTGGDAAITDGVRKAWQDRPNWPASLQRASAPFGDRRIWEFIERAVAARKAKSS